MQNVSMQDGAPMALPPGATTRTRTSRAMSARTPGVRAPKRVASTTPDLRCTRTAVRAPPKAATGRPVLKVNVAHVHVDSAGLGARNAMTADVAVVSEEDIRMEIQRLTIVRDAGLQPGPGQEVYFLTVLRQLDDLHRKLHER